MTSFNLDLAESPAGGGREGEMRSIQPIDESPIEQLAGSHELLVTLENDAIAAAAGGAVNEVVNQYKYKRRDTTSGIAGLILRSRNRGAIAGRNQLDG